MQSSLREELCSNQPRGSYLKYLVENKVRFGDDFKEVVLMKTRDKEVTYSLVDADLPDAPDVVSITDADVQPDED